MISHSLFCRKQLTSPACHWWSLSFPNSPIFISRLTYFISFPPSVLFFSSPSCSSCHYTRRKELNWLLEELQVHLWKYMASGFLILTTKPLLRAYCMHKILLSQRFLNFPGSWKAFSVSLIFSRWLQTKWNVWQFNWLSSKVQRI